MMKNTNATRLVVLTGLLLATLWAANLHVETRQAKLEQAVHATIAKLNAEGRLPLRGYTGGMLNNLVQTVRGEARPLGCGGQAEELYKALNAARLPGWTFTFKYEYGFKSPILLPHQWIEARGPNGETVELDAWSGYTSEVY